LTEAEPLHTPQVDGFENDEIDVIADGSVIIIVVSSTHPEPSVIEQVIAPAHNPDAVAPTCKSDQLMVYGGVPPEGATVIWPVQSPLQATFVITAFAIIGAGSLIVNVIVVSQTPASKMVTLYVPAQSVVAVGVV
jgi:hypothetical protein